MNLKVLVFKFGTKNLGFDRVKMYFYLGVCVCKKLIFNLWFWRIYCLENVLRTMIQCQEEACKAKIHTRCVFWVLVNSPCEACFPVLSYAFLWKWFSLKIFLSLLIEKICCFFFFFFFLTHLLMLLVASFFLILIRDGASGARPRFYFIISTIQSYCNGAYICSWTGTQWWYLFCFIAWLLPLLRASRDSMCFMKSRFFSFF